MDLERLVESKKEAYEVWAEFGGIDFKLRYMDRTALQRLVERSRTRRYDRRTHQPVEDVDVEKLSRNLARLITGWRGLTLGKLACLVPIKVAPDEAGTDVPYSLKNAEILVREVYGLDTFLADTVTDLGHFLEKQLETEVKNSPASHGSI